MMKKLIPFLALCALLPACTDSGPGMNKQPNVELIQDMMDQPALKPQDYQPYDVNEAAARLPPEHTLPRGYKRYPYHNDPAAGATGNKNPNAGQMTPEILNVGRQKFDIYCAVCHGPQGKGDGTVAVKMALKPPSLVSDKIVAASDGAIYHIITDGQGVMASYAYQIQNENDRWAIVNYVRSLQKLSKGQ